MAPEAVLLEGKVLAQKIQGRIKSFVDQCHEKKISRPRIQVIQPTNHPSSQWYIDQQKKLAEKLGVEFKLGIGPKEVPDQKELERQVSYFSKHSETHGIFVSMPLPQGFDADKVFLAMDPMKDVEGVHPASLGLMVLRKSKMIPPTANAAFQLIESTNTQLRGKTAVIVGQSAIVGRPLQLMLGERGVTTIVCNSGTSVTSLERLVSMGDLVIGCAGQPGLIKGTWIKEGAMVIDVGTTEVNGKLVGDIEFEEAKKRASFITPVPGGVGPLTVTLLFENLIRAYDWQRAV